MPSRLLFQKRKKTCIDRVLMKFADLGALPHYGFSLLLLPRPLPLPAPLPLLPLPFLPLLSLLSPFFGSIDLKRIMGGKPKSSLAAQSQHLERHGRRWPPCCHDNDNHTKSVRFGEPGGDSGQGVTSEGPSVRRKRSARLRCLPEATSGTDNGNESPPLTSSIRIPANGAGAPEPDTRQGPSARPPRCAAAGTDFQVFPDIILYETCLEQWIRDCSPRAVPHLFL